MLNVQCRKALLMCLFSAIVAITCSSAAAYGPADAHTWGIENAGLGITAGNVITNAKLTIYSAAFDPASSIKTATIRLLNNPALGMTSYADGQTGDYFADCGALVAELKSGSLGSSPQNVVIDLGQKNDPAAPIWQNFGQPFEVTLGNGSKVSYSSVMVALLDYAGSGRSFGFGIDCDGFTFTDLSLELTVASMSSADPAQTLRFSASGNTPPPPVSDTVIIDNGDSTINKVGTWPVSGGLNPYGTDSVYNRSAGNSFSWLFTAPETGSYEVSMWWTAFSSRSSAAPVQVQHAAGTASTTVNQLTNGGQWNTLGTYQYQAGTTYRVTVSTLADNTTICADAVRFTKGSGTPPPPANNPPVIEAVADQTVTVSNTLTFTVSTSDPDGDSVSLSAQNLPTGATFANKSFSWTPSVAQVGTHEVTLIADDANGGTDSITVQITVQAASSQWVELTYDDFEAGWGNYIDGGADCLLYRNTKYAHQGTSAANIQSGSGTASSFRSQPLDVSSYSELTIDFWYMPVSMESGDRFRLDYYDGAQWRTLKRWTAETDFTSFTFHSETVTILKTNYAFPANMRIRFVCEATNTVDDVMIDEIRISAR